MPLLDIDDLASLCGKINLVTEQMRGLTPPQETNLSRSQCNYSSELALTAERIGTALALIFNKHRLGLVAEAQSLDNFALGCVLASVGLRQNNQASTASDNATTATDTGFAYIIQQTGAKNRSVYACALMDSFHNIFPFKLNQSFTFCDKILGVIQVTEFLDLGAFCLRGAVEVE